MKTDDGVKFAVLQMVRVDACAVPDKKQPIAMAAESNKGLVMKAPFEGPKDKPNPKGD